MPPQLDQEGIARRRGSAWGNRLWRYGPALAWVALVSWASTDVFASDRTFRVIGPWLHRLFPEMCLETVLWLHVLIRKAAHVTEYAIFAWLASRALVGSSRSYLRRAWFAWSFALLVLMASVDEYHQSFVPGRTASLGDVIFDVTGGLAMLSTLLTWRLVSHVENRRGCSALANCPKP
jgi:VanZ like family